MTLLIGAESLAAPAAADDTTTVRLIGNSPTYWNGGLDNQIDSLAPLGSVLPISADKEVEGGASLQYMCTETNAVQKTRSGEYDFVVL